MILFAIALTLYSRDITLTLPRRSVALTLFCNGGDGMACSSANRKAKESPVSQGADEEIAYTLTTTPWGSSPSSVTVTVKYEKSGQDVTASTTTGSASVSGDVITLPVIHSLRADHEYRVEIQFTAGGNVYEPFFIIEAST